MKTKKLTVLLLLVIVLCQIVFIFVNTNNIFSVVNFMIASVLFVLFCREKQYLNSTHSWVLKTVTILLSYTTGYLTFYYIFSWLGADDHIFWSALGPGVASAFSGGNSSCGKKLLFLD